MRYLAALTASLALVLIGTVLTGCPPDPKANARLHFYNDCTDDFVDYVRGINLQPGGSEDWGENLIVGEIAPGSSRLITGLYPGTYRIRVLLRSAEGWYYSYSPEETFDLASRATREFRYARGWYEIGPLVYH